jgi:hypothetical protein
MCPLIDVEILDYASNFGMYNGVVKDGKFVQLFSSNNKESKKEGRSAKHILDTSRNKC